VYTTSGGTLNSVTSASLMASETPDLESGYILLSALVQTTQVLVGEACQCSAPRSTRARKIGCIDLSQPDERIEGGHGELADMVEKNAKEVDHAFEGELDVEEVEEVIGDAKAAADKLRAAGLTEEAAAMDEKRGGSHPSSSRGWPITITIVMQECESEFSAYNHLDQPLWSRSMQSSFVINTPLVGGRSGPSIC